MAVKEQIKERIQRSMRTMNAYIWIGYKSSTGSSSSSLELAQDNVFVRDMIEKINSYSPLELYNHRPDWLSDCVEIRISLQDINTGKTVYERMLYPEIKMQPTFVPVIGRFKEEGDPYRFESNLHDNK